MALTSDEVNFLIYRYMLESGEAFPGPTVAPGRRSDGNVVGGRVSALSFHLQLGEHDREVEHQRGERAPWSAHHLHPEGDAVPRGRVAHWGCE